MRKVLTVPEFDEPLVKLCAALRVMQVHRQERLVLEVVPSLSALASAEPDSAVGVLKVPVPDPGQEMEDFLAALEELSASAPDLPVMAMLPPPLSTSPGALDQASRWVRSLREAGADEFLPCSEEGTPMTLARRLETVLRSEFSTDFLQALASDLATQQWLVLGRFLEGLRDGVVLPSAELATACQREPEALCTAFRSEGLGSLDDWRCRGVVYGVFRRAEEEDISVRDAARGFGFDHLEDFDAVCRAGAGSPARQLEACGGWREVLQVLAERIDARFHGVDDDPREPAGALGPQEGPPELCDLLKRHRPTVCRVARARLESEDDAEDVAQNVCARVVQLHPEQWLRLSEGFFVRAASNAAVDLTRKWACEPVAAPVEEVEVPCGERPADARLMDAEMGRTVREALRRLPPARALVIWLRYAHGWKPREIAALVGRTSDSVQKLARRGRADFERGWSARER